MEPYLQTIRHIFEKSNTYFDHNSLSSFFEDGVSFPKFLAIILKNEKIPDLVKNPKNGSEKDQNNKKCIEYIENNYHLFQSTNFNLQIEKDQITVVSAILSQIYFRMSESEILSQCNKGIQPKNQFKTFQELLSIEGINKFAKIMTSGNDFGDDYESLKRNLELKGIPLIVQPDHFNKYDQYKDLFIFQMAILLKELKPDSKKQQKVKSNTLIVSGKASKLKALKGTPATTISHSSTSLLAKNVPGFSRTEDNIPLNASTKKLRRSSDFDFSTISDEEKLLFSSDDNSYIDSDSIEHEDTNVDDSVSATYTRIVNYLLVQHFNNTNLVIQSLNNLCKSEALPKLITIVCENYINKNLFNGLITKLQNSEVDKKSKVLKIIFQMIDDKTLQTTILNLTSQNINLKNDEEIIGFLKALFLTFIYNSDGLKKLYLQCNSIFTKFKMKINDIINDWRDGSKLNSLLLLLDTSLKSSLNQDDNKKIIVRSSLFTKSHHYYYLKKKILALNIPLLIHRNSLNTNDFISILFQVQSIINEIQNQNISVQSKFFVYVDKESFNENLISNVSDKHTVLLNTLNIIGKENKVFFRDIKNLGESVYLYNLLKVLLSVNEIPNYDLTENDNQNLKNIIEYIGTVNHCFRSIYFNFDKDDEQLYENSCVVLAENLLKHFFLKSSKRDMINRINSIILKRQKHKKALDIKLLTNLKPDFIENCKLFLIILDIDYTYDDGALDGFIELVNDEFKKLNIPFIFSEIELDNIFVEDYFFYQYQFIFNYLDMKKSFSNIPETPFSLSDFFSVNQDRDLHKNKVNSTLNEYAEKTRMKYWDPPKPSKVNVYNSVIVYSGNSRTNEEYFQKQLGQIFSKDELLNDKTTVNIKEEEILPDAISRIPQVIMTYDPTTFMWNTNIDEIDKLKINYQNLDTILFVNSNSSLTLEMCTRLSISVRDYNNSYKDKCHVIAYYIDNITEINDKLGLKTKGSGFERALILFVQNIDLVDNVFAESILLKIYSALSIHSNIIISILEDIYSESQREFLKKLNKAIKALMKETAKIPEILTIIPYENLFDTSKFVYFEELSTESKIPQKLKINISNEFINTLIIMDICDFYSYSLLWDSILKHSIFIENNHFIDDINYFSRDSRKISSILTQKNASSIIGNRKTELEGYHSQLLKTQSKKSLSGYPDTILRNELKIIIEAIPELKQYIDFQKLYNIELLEQKMKERIQLESNDNINRIKENMKESLNAYGPSQLIRLEKSHYIFLETAFYSMFHEAVRDYSKLSQFQKILTDQMEQDKSTFQTIFDEYYKDEEKRNQEIELTLEEERRNSMKYIMKESETLKEITVEITVDSDIKSKIPKDY